VTSFLSAPPGSRHICPGPSVLLNRAFVLVDLLFLPTSCPYPPLLSASLRFRRSYDGIPLAHCSMLVCPAVFDSPVTLCRHVFWGHLSEPGQLRSPVGTLCRIFIHEYLTPLYEGFVDRKHGLACFAFHSSFPSLPRPTRVPVRSTLVSKHHPAHSLARGSHSRHCLLV